MSSRQKGSEADWICSDSKCGNLNFARRSNCNRCGKVKEMSSDSKKKQGIEIGKVAAEKSHGLFSAEDWQCSKCGNVNWARRQTCNVCNAPKVGEVEERTGYGGGFNEREGVEYVKRDESDDEFDELGRRRRKKLKSDSAPPKVEEEVVKTKPVCEAEESEEDDDDDGDLSKYDLWQDDDDEENDDKDEKIDKDKVARNGGNENAFTCEKEQNSSSSHSSRSSHSSSRAHSGSKDCSPPSSYSRGLSPKSKSRRRERSR